MDMLYLLEYFWKRSLRRTCFLRNAALNDLCNLCIRSKVERRVVKCKASHAENLYHVHVLQTIDTKLQYTPETSMDSLWHHGVLLQEAREDILVGLPSIVVWT